MRLDINPIASVRIEGKFYGAVVVDERSEHFRVYTLASYHAIGEIENIAPPCLDFGNDKVWLGVKCLDTKNGGFASGGYLRTVEGTFTFTLDGTSTSEIVRVRLLGLEASEYRGGVRIDGLSLPGSLIDNTPTGRSGHRWAQIEQGETYPPEIIRLNNGRRSLYASRHEYWAVGDGSFSGTMPTSFHNDMSYQQFKYD